jgi:hypothetical protein
MGFDLFDIEGELDEAVFEEEEKVTTCLLSVSAFFCHYFYSHTRSSCHQPSLPSELILTHAHSPFTAPRLVPEGVW